MKACEGIALCGKDMVFEGAQEASYHLPRYCWHSIQGLEANTPESSALAEEVIFQ